jgi:hypothetical protein
VTELDRAADAELERAVYSFSEQETTMAKMRNGFAAICTRLHVSEASQKE